MLSLAPGIVLVVVTLIATACAARAPVRPTGAGTPDPTASDAFVAATKQCPGLKTMTAELRLSGRAGTETIRGTLHAGLAAPASMRVEALAPFGQPVFVLAGRDDRATLLFPRDDRVLADAAVAAVLERLTGLALGARDLRLILTGCVSGTPAADGGTAFPGGWQSVRLSESIVAYLKVQNGERLLVAVDYGNWRVDYAEQRNGFPRRVRIRSATGAVVDVSAALTELEVNTEIDDRAFEVVIPPGAIAMSLEQLGSVTQLRPTQ